MAQGLNPDSVPDNGLIDYVVGDKLIGYILKMSVTRYRSLPVSCIEKLELKIDGEDVKVEDMTFAINGKRFMIEQLKDLWAEYWNINNQAELQVLKIGGLNPGQHHVQLNLRMRVPYIYENDAMNVQREEFKNYKFSVDDCSCDKVVTLVR